MEQIGKNNELTCVHVWPEVPVEGDVPSGDGPGAGVLQLPGVDVLVPPGHVARRPVHRVRRALGCNSIDIMNFGHETGHETGPSSGPNSVKICLKTPK